MALPPHRLAPTPFGREYLTKSKPNETRMRLRPFYVAVRENLGYPLLTEKIADHLHYLRNFLVYGEELQACAHDYLHTPLVRNGERGPELANAFAEWNGQLLTLLDLLRWHIRRLGRFEGFDPWIVPQDVRELHGQFWLLFRYEELYPKHPQMYYIVANKLRRHFSPSFAWTASPAKREELDNRLANLVVLRQRDRNERRRRQEAHLRLARQARFLHSLQEMTSPVRSTAPPSTSSEDDDPSTLWLRVANQGYHMVGARDGFGVLGVGDCGRSIWSRRSVSALSDPVASPPPTTEAEDIL